VAANDWFVVGSMQVTENLKGTLPSAAFVGLARGAGVDTKPSELAF
jgi:hypothetical protein